MNLCGRQLKIFSLSLLCLGWAIFSAETAKAAITLDSYSHMDDAHKTQQENVWMGFQATTTDCANPILIVAANTEYNTGADITNITYNGDNLTLLFDNSNGSNRNVVYYTQTPDIGNHTVKVYQNWGVNIAQSFSFCGVDSISSEDLNYWLNSGAWGATSPMVYNIADDNSVLLSISTDSISGQITASTSETYIQGINWNGAHNQSWYSFKNAIEGGSFNFNIQNGVIHTTGYMVLAPAITDYCGDGSCNGDETFNDCPQDCQPEDFTLPTDNYNPFFFSNPYDCINNSTCKLRYVYNEDVFTGYDYLEIRSLANIFATTSTFVASSTIIDTTGFFTDKYNGQSYFNLTNGTTTDEQTKYYLAIGHISGYWSPDLGDVPATTTEEYVIAVNWQNTLDLAKINGAVDYFNATGTNTIIGGISAHDLACSAEEWGDYGTSTSTSGIFDINWKWIKCSYLESFIVVGSKISNIAISGAKLATNQLGAVFPFNIPVKFYGSWMNSASTTLPTQLDWLNIADAEGNIYLDWPAEWSETGTTTQLQVWGDIFTTPGSKEAEIFAGIRWLSGMLYWLGFIWFVWYEGLNVYHELNDHEKNNSSSI